MLSDSIVVAFMSLPDGTALTSTQASQHQNSPFLQDFDPPTSVVGVGAVCDRVDGNECMDDKLTRPGANCP